MSVKGSPPENENVGSRLELSLSRSSKVILPNKTGMSARSSSPKMKIEEEQENTAELGNDAQLDSRTKLDERT